MKDFDWKLVHLCLFRVKTDEDSAKPRLKVEHLGSQKFFETGQELLEELIDKLLTTAWGKKVDINESSSCRAYPFKATHRGGEDRQLLEELVASPNLEDFEVRANTLTEHYASIPRSRPGVLVHVVATIDAGRAKALPFYFLFKCDFEDARQLGDDRNIVPVPEVILEKLKKMLCYPFFDGFAQDAERVKLFQASASDYFHEVVDVERPATAKELFQQELASAVQSRHEHRYDNYFVGEPPKKRELFGQDRIIPLNDLLPAPEVKYVTEKTCRAAKDKYDKQVKVSIKIDEQVKFEADMAGLNRSFFFAQKGDMRFIIIRGERFVGGGQLTGLDFLDVEQLDDIMPRVTEDTGGGFSNEDV
jgi:hypothetical protein